MLVTAAKNVLKTPLATMETVFQEANDPALAEAQLSPPEQMQRLWKRQAGFMPFVKQKRVIDESSELLPYASLLPLKGWASPRAFALQGLVLAAFIFSVINWYQTRESGTLQDEIVALQANVQAEMKRDAGIRDATEAEIKRILHPSRNSFQPVAREEALQQMRNSLEDSRKSEEEYKRRAAAQEKELRAEQSAQTIAYSGTPLMFSLALVLAAGLVASGLRNDFPKSNVRAAGDYYLYFATAGGLWLNLLFLLFLHFALSGSAYGLSGLSATVGLPFWIVFWFGFYGLLVHYLARVARNMHKVMQIRPPAGEWSLDNKMLLRVHNSFVLMFVALEAMFLSGTYFFYLYSRRVA